MAIIPGTNSGETLTGTNGDDTITALAGIDGLYGLAGTDSLDGGLDGDYLYGGPGDDTMLGGAGDDHYYVDSAGDQVVEQPGEGTDFVSTSVDFTLPDNVEHMYLTGTGDINGTGNALKNTIRDNAGINILAGGAGNDSYVVQNTGDQVIELANEGTDYVNSTASFTLGANIENLVLKGTSNINGTGNDLNNTLTGNTGINVLAGAAGSDHYFVQNSGDQVVEQPGEGTDFVHTSVDFTLPDNVEHMYLTGTGAINGTGNALRNTIRDNAGINILAGGAGIDSYVVQNTGDQVIEQASDKDADYVSSSATFTLSANVEHLVLTGNADIDGTGNELNNHLTGNSGNNVLNGGNGKDTLSGGGGDDEINGGNGKDTIDGQAGDDILRGGAEDDTYTVDSAGDQVVEQPNQGTDQGTDIVYSSVTFTLDANVENLTLTGSGNINGTGNGLGNTIIGNAGSNVLTGGSGEDILDGGAGADTMDGGARDDSYKMENVADQVVEQANQGTDIVYSSVTFTLGDNVENLTLTGNGAITGTGNELNNILTGNSGNSKLIGGDGNDTYWVNNASVQVVEQANQGTDHVLSTVTFTLGDNVENLSLIGYNVIHDGTGNELDNTIYGEGICKLFGRGGNDFYIISSEGTSVQVIEQENEGVDTVTIQNGTFTLPDNVENLVLRGSAVTGIGNALDNSVIVGYLDHGATLNGGGGDDVVSGGLGNDILDGGTGADTMNGGEGHDQMSGGPGEDIFVFSTELKNTGDTTPLIDWDMIDDFSPLDDEIHLDLSVFTALLRMNAPGTYLEPDDFFIGDETFNSGAHIIYNDVTGGVFYDFGREGLYPWLSVREGGARPCSHRSGLFRDLDRKSIAQLMEA